MLQRSPSYIVATPTEDKVANWLYRHLPAGLAPRIARWRSILVRHYFYRMARRW